MQVLTVLSMANFWKIVNDVIKEADIILEVVDARCISESRNKEIELKVQKAGKRLLIVLNKADLVEKENALKNAPKNSVLVSAKGRMGTTILKKKILELSRGEPVRIGVVGYPNTGKSSVINSLAGRSKASTSPQSGYTKGLQYVRAGKIKLIDTPGVIPFKEGDDFKQALIGAKDFNRVKEPDIIAMKLIESRGDEILQIYDVKKDNKEADELLEEIALKKNHLIRGGKPDLEKVSRRIIMDWQRGVKP